MSANLNFRSDIQIDEMSLDEELVRQPSMYFDYSEALNEAKNELSKMELQLSVKKAEIGFQIRTGVYSYDGKVTEGVISDLIEKDEDYVNLKKEVINKKREVDKLSSATESIRTRRYSLQKLVDLWISRYYGDVKGNGSRRPNADRTDGQQLSGLRDSLRDEYDEQKYEGED